MIKTSRILFLFLVLSCDFSPRLHKEILLAQKMIQSQNYEESIKLYKAILKKNPENEIKVKIYYQLGELYSINLMENAESVKYYKKVKEYTEEPLWLVKSEERIGDINFEFLKNYDQSKDSYENLVRIEPKLSRYDLYEYRLAISYYRLKQYKRSKEVFLRVSKNSKHRYFFKSFYYIGLIEYELKNWDKAISFWKKYISVEKRRDGIIQARFMMANAYETKEDLKTAYNIYYSILGKYPNTEVIKNRLQSIYDRRVARKR